MCFPLPHPSDERDRRFFAFLRAAVYTVTAIAAVWFVFHTLLGALLPFGVAFAVAHATRRPMLSLAEKWRIPRGAAVCLVSLGLPLLVFALLCFLTKELISECALLASRLDTGALEESVKSAFDVLSAALERLSPSLAESLAASGRAETLVHNALQSVFTGVMALILDAARASPGILVAVGVGTVALYWFAADYEAIAAAVRGRMTEGVRRFFDGAVVRFLSTVYGILRAYGVLLAMTFLELAAGFFLMRLPYALLAAALIALVDILPVFGTGTILVPWGLFDCFFGNFKNGLCILVLYGIIAAVRQIAEPKIMGDAMGLHPLATLAAMYAGLTLCGLAGLFGFPLLFVIIKKLYDDGLFSFAKAKDDAASEERTVSS